MDIYGYNGVFLVKRLFNNAAFEISNMSDITKANPRGCDNGALTNRFGVLIQGLLAIVAFSTLMVKRFREPVGIRRPWRIWYLMNFLLDATLGMLVIWAGVKVVSRIVEYKQFTLLTFGEYGDPPQAAAWLGQCGVYLLIMVLEKSVVSLVLLIPGWTNLQSVLLDYIPNPQVELVLVMLIVPFIVNSIMFWVVDSLMMRKYKTLKSLVDSSTKVASTAPWVTGDESRVLLTVETDTEEDCSTMVRGGSHSSLPVVGIIPSWVEV
ncbi:transmembrane protein 110, like isoform X2 [Salvelinus namaycush]|uniref:Transmembrane protein 110, like isoform X2 n=1 Tax=Salvelinus namaycush TaxID=8040 RepID=A0A8U0QXY9_SALNM|nr:transmembrane protein 110, like isoform X2 [Salvelinus namaycush]